MSTDIDFLIISENSRWSSRLKVQTGSFGFSQRSWNIKLKSHCRKTELLGYEVLLTSPPPTVLSCFPPFSFPDGLCDPTDLICRKGSPFEAMTGRTAPSSDGLLAEVFWGFPQLLANARRSVHSPQDHFIITLLTSDRRDWRDTRGKWPLARNPDRSCRHGHTSVMLFWPQLMAPWTPKKIDITSLETSRLPRDNK